MATYPTINDGVRNGLPMPSGAGQMGMDMACCHTGDTSCDGAMMQTYANASSPTPPAKTPTAMAPMVAAKRAMGT